MRVTMRPSPLDGAMTADPLRTERVVGRMSERSSAV
jgi:hypothetical protein